MAKDEANGNMKRMAGVAAFSAIACALTAVMLTPKSGQDMRNSMKGRAQDLRHKAKDKLEEAEQS